MVKKLTSDRYGEECVSAKTRQCTVGSLQYVQRVIGAAALLPVLAVLFFCSVAYANDVAQDSKAAANALENKRIFFAPDERVSINRKTGEEDDRELTRVPPDPEVVVTKRVARPQAAVAPAPHKPLYGIHYQARLVIGDAMYFVVNNIPCEPFSMEGAIAQSTQTLSCHGLDARGYRLRVSKDAQSLLVMKGATTIGTIVPGQTL